jgi:hypothetical protein
MGRYVLVPQVIILMSETNSNIPVATLDLKSMMITDIESFLPSDLEEEEGLHDLDMSLKLFKNDRLYVSLKKSKEKECKKILMACFAYDKKTGSFRFLFSQIVFDGYQKLPLHPIRLNEQHVWHSNKDTFLQFKRRIFVISCIDVRNSLCLVNCFYDKTVLPIGGSNLGIPGCFQLLRRSGEILTTTNSDKSTSMFLVEHLPHRPQLPDSFKICRLIIS